MIKFVGTYFLYNGGEIMAEKLHPDMPNQEDMNFMLWYRIYLLHKSGREYVNIKYAYDLLGELFGLSDEQRNYQTNSGENEWEAKVRSSYAYLKKHNIIKSDPSKDGDWCLTENGIKKIEEFIPPTVTFQ